MGTKLAEVVAGMITIIPEACTPAITTTPAKIHRIPMTPILMTAEAGILAEEGIEANHAAAYHVA